MSRAQRAQAKSMRKLLFNLLGNAPMGEIMAGESCSWSMTPEQEEGVSEGLQTYVKAVTGKDVKVAKRIVVDPKDDESCA